MLSFLIGLYLGAFLGVLVAAMCAAAARGDDMDSQSERQSAI